MKIHLVWIRATAAAALVAGVSVHPAAAQYAPFKPIPPQPVAPQATAPAPQYVATLPAYTQVPTAQYQATVTPYQPQAAQYPQTAARYPAAYSTTPYVAQATPTEALPSPQPPAAAAPAADAATPAVVEQTAPAANAAPANPGAPANCNCGPNGYATSGYGTACGSYPGVSNYFSNDCGPQNIWFGGVYWLFMNRDEPSCKQMTVEFDPTTKPDPYYPMAGDTVLCTSDVAPDFRSGVEVRLGSTFVVGGSSCNTGCGYGYPGCGPSPCSPGTMYAWEVAWWGLDDNPNDQTVSEMPNMRMYGMKTFVGLEFDRDGAGATYDYCPVNNYYGYSMPVNAMPGTPPADYIKVLSQRVYSNFKAQNLELNVMRFGACEIASPGCGYSACGCDSGCNAGCGCGSNLSMYGSCGVRYFRIDDDFSYDTEAGIADGAGGWDHNMPNGFQLDNALCYDINVDNNLVGPQVGWTTNYAVGCRWNFFLNSTFGIFDNHINVSQRMWSPGGGDVRFITTGDTFDFNCSKDRVSFLGELRAGGSYDLTCHWRAVAAYRVVAATGIATSQGQFASQYVDPRVVTCINANDSLFVHGVEVGAECRY